MEQVWKGGPTTGFEAGGDVATVEVFSKHLMRSITTGPRCPSVRGPARSEEEMKKPSMPPANQIRIRPSSKPGVLSSSPAGGGAMVKSKLKVSPHSNH